MEPWTYLKMVCIDHLILSSQLSSNILSKFARHSSQNDFHIFAQSRLLFIRVQRIQIFQKTVPVVEPLLESKSKSDEASPLIAQPDVK